MRVVTWDEFAKLPPGTIYSKRKNRPVTTTYGKPLWEGLYVKGEMAGDYDHWEANLTPDEDGPANVGAVFNLDMTRSACEGHDPHEYAIYGIDELQALHAVVSKAMEHATYFPK